MTLYQQLHILAFMGMALVHLSTAASWDCTSDSNNPIECHVTLNSDNSFWVREANGQACTHDGKYCGGVGVVPDQQYLWQFTATNNGVSCSDTCDPQTWCNANNYCTSSCSKEAC